MSFHSFAEGINLPVYFGHMRRTLKRNLQDLLAPGLEEVAACLFSWCAFCYLWPASGIFPAKSMCTSSIDLYLFGLQTSCVCVGDLFFSFLFLANDGLLGNYRFVLFHTKAWLRWESKDAISKIPVGFDETNSFILLSIEWSAWLWWHSQIYIYYGI